MVELAVLQRSKQLQFFQFLTLEFDNVTITVSQAAYLSSSLPCTINQPVVAHDLLKFILGGQGTRINKWIESGYFDIIAR